MCRNRILHHTTLVRKKVGYINEMFDLDQSPKKTGSRARRAQNRRCVSIVGSGVKTPGWCRQAKRASKGEWQLALLCTMATRPPLYYGNSSSSVLCPLLLLCTMPTRSPLYYAHSPSSALWQLALLCTMASPPPSEHSDSSNSP